MNTATSPGVHERLLSTRAALDDEDEQLLPVDAKLYRPGDMAFARRRRSLMAVIFGKRRGLMKEGGSSLGIGEASVYHALVIIFLEYFSWGLLTVPVINVLADVFPTNKFLMNGLILGVKGFLSFLSAPMLGALSDSWGRKSFLLLTVICTCMPIPCLKISPWWYFALFSISGLFSVTFSVVLAYVADITEKEDRSAAYGLVSATFAASLVTSPALGAWLSEAWSDEAVVMLATAVAALDVLFILVAVPESLPPKLRHTYDRLSWQHADPLATLRVVWEDRMVMLLAFIVFLSYLPEAGQFSCFFVYLKLVVGFSPEAVAAYIGLVGILSVFSQTFILLILTKTCGTKHTITIGLCCQFAQLFWYGVGTQYWMMWAAGLLAAMSQLTYPSISAFVSVHTDRDKQGTVQGVVTGIRGLCQGLGPAVFGFVFYLFNMDLNIDGEGTGHIGVGSQFPAPRIRLPPLSGGYGQPKVLTPRRNQTVTERPLFDWRLIPGPPFLFGAVMVLLALLVNSMLPHNPPTSGKFIRTRLPTPSHSREPSVDGLTGLLSDDDEEMVKDRKASL
uniref:Major facilitator superfamily (MFS) profile domain-containing protein n=2 Tax=Plectus sambesii TaxID=2011161 RepID=A0A914UQW1_9BILA